MINVPGTRFFIRIVLPKISSSSKSDLSKYDLHLSVFFTKRCVAANKFSAWQKVLHTLTLRSIIIFHNTVIGTFFKAARKSILKKYSLPLEK